ncbi:MAG: PQQ-dependent sugar dehydrogenase [Rhizobacter sp.]|nr:PQQ-dependent sugar dehydrogenase [Ferruginibacter sp.]
MRNLYAALKFSFLFIICLTRVITADAQNPFLVYQPVVTGLINPVDAVTAPGDGRMFIAQQNGLIRIRNGASLTTFADINAVLTSPLGGEQGLLSLAFHPDYASNRYLFVLYTGANGDIRLARYRRDATNANTIEAGGTVLLSIPKPTPVSSYTNHNGGKIIFGTDGYLYMSTGDGGSGNDPNNNAQNRASLLGKMLRLDVNSFATTSPFYNIPSTNPYAGNALGYREEIYAFGLRNPWRWSFDRANGDMWIGDVGQGAWEEVNWKAAGTALGGNFGWRCFEGAHPSGNSCSPVPTDTISPVFEYDRTASGGQSITGGYVYRGAAAPALQGFYLVTDYVSGNIWKIRPNSTGSWQVYFQAAVPATRFVSGFAEGPAGELYAIRRSNGSIDSVIVTTVLPVIISNFLATGKTGFNELSWATRAEVNTSRFYVEFGTDGSSFTRVGSIAASGANNGRQYNYRHTISQEGYVYYRLAVEDADGAINYSNIVRVKSGNVNPVKVSPSIVTNSMLNIELTQPAKELQLINTNGAVVFRKNLQGIIGNIPIMLPALPKAVYILSVAGPEINFKEKIIIQ